MTIVIESFIPGISKDLIIYYWLCIWSPEGLWCLMCWLDLVFEDCCADGLLGSVRDLLVAPFSEFPAGPTTKLYLDVFGYTSVIMCTNLRTLCFMSRTDQKRTVHFSPFLSYYKVWNENRRHFTVSPQEPERGLSSFGKMQLGERMSKIRLTLLTLRQHASSTSQHGSLRGPT